MQSEIDFTTKSPVNIEKLSGQNRRLYDFLKLGNRINCFSDAMKELKIGYLNSRISDLKKLGVDIQKDWIVIDETHVKEYYL